MFAMKAVVLLLDILCYFYIETESLPYKLIWDLLGSVYICHSLVNWVKLDRKLCSGMH